MPFSHIQDCNQTLGPGRPTVGQLKEMLDKIPKHHDIEAIAINGQTSTVYIDTLHEGLHKIFEFNVGKKI